MKVIVEVKDGKVIGVYSNEEGHAEIYYDLDIHKMSDEELDAMDEKVAEVPFVLWSRDRESHEDNQQDNRHVH